MSLKLVRVAALGGAAALGAGTLPCLPSELPAQVPGAVSATEVGIVRGRVLEAGSQRPVADAQVSVVGTTIGTITNASGEFVLPRVPAGTRSLLVRRIGFGASTREINVAAGGETRLDVTLAQAAAQLDQIVVTGTATATTRRTVGNAITQLDAAELTEKSTFTNVTDLLQSKSPGVTLIPGAGSAGAAADIRIRGTNSLSGSNRPIFFIDGVRFNDGAQGQFGASGAGDGTFAQGVSALDMINPNDIESIEVIKGPAAATLYGADAAGGVIQIITKKGARNQQRVQWTARADVGGTNWALPTQTNYTTCTQARIDARIAAGALAGRPQWEGCQGLAPGTVISGNPLRDDPLALRTGLFQNYSLSARGGAERYNFFVSGNFLGDKGVQFNNLEERSGLRANFGYAPSDRLDFQINTGYDRRRLRQSLGDDAGGGLIISHVRGQPGNTNNGGRGWRINTPELTNEYNNTLTADRYLTGATLNFRPLSWFRNRLTAGLDFTDPVARIYYAPFSAFSAGDFPSGYLSERNQQTRLTTIDYAGTLAKSFRQDKYTTELTFGAQGVKTRIKTLRGEVSGLPSADFGLFQNGTTPTSSSDFIEQASLGYYGQLQLGFSNRLFLTGAVRADDNSAFGTDFDRVLYPKASLSYVISEEPALEGLFRRIRADNFRVRAAFGQAGRAPGPFDAQRTYTSSRVVVGNGTVASGLIQSAPGNENLTAERGTELEYGFDAAFLDGRLGVEFTGYNKRTEDALVSIPNAPSLGFTASRFINFGEIKNSGLELGLRATPVRGRRVTWDATFTLATNQNEMTKLAVGGVSQIIPFNPYAASAFPIQIIREGYPIAGFWAVDARRTASGGYDTTATGVPIIDSTLRYVGPPTPKYEGAFGSTVTLFRNVRLYGLIDFKGGHFLLNQRERNRSQSANLNNLLFNDPSRPLTRQDTLYYTGPSTRRWIQPADFIKLRDVSIGYTIPTGLLRAVRANGLQNTTITLAAHNIGFISKKYDGIDPEVNFFGNSTFRTFSSFAQFVRVDSYTQPMMRRITASINANF
jgi:TonB-linked SusC/RagA family outer membrane protein